MNKKLFNVWMVIPILGFVVILCLVLYLAGVVGPVVCFGVDSKNRLYVGFGEKIEVYEDNTVIKELSPKTSKSYLFTILPDDTILLTTASVNYKLDLEGNVIEKIENAGSQLYHDLQKKKKLFLSPKGDLYKMRNILGRTLIVKNENVVYKEPVVSVIVGYVMLIIAAILIVSVFTLVRGTRRRFA